MFSDKVQKRHASFANFSFPFFLFFPNAERERKEDPTSSNGLILNFRLSSDAEISLMRTDRAYKSAWNVQKTCMQLVHTPTELSCCMPPRCWLGRRRRRERERSCKFAAQRQENIFLDMEQEEETNFSWSWQHCTTLHYSRTPINMCLFGNQFFQNLISNFGTTFLLPK